MPTRTTVFPPVKNSRTTRSTPDSRVSSEGALCGRGVASLGSDEAIVARDHPDVMLAAGLGSSPSRCCLCIAANRSFSPPTSFSSSLLRTLRECNSPSAYPAKPPNSMVSRVSVPCPEFRAKPSIAPIAISATFIAYFPRRPRS